MTAVVESVGTLNQDTGAANHVVPKPAGTVAGNLLLLVGSLDQGQTVTLPSGFASNVLVNELSGSVGGGGAVRLSASWKIAGASEPASYTAVLGSAAGGAWGLRRISGFNAAAPIHLVATPAKDTDASAECPNPTTTIADVLMLLDVALGGGRTITPPGGAVAVDWNLDAIASSGAGGRKVQASPGAIGVETYSWTTGINWIASAIGIAPAASASTVILRRRRDGY